MFTQFISKKMNLAKYKILADGSYFGEIPVVKGVWASAKNLEECRRELQEVLEDWLLLKVKTGEKVPDFSIRFDRRALLRSQ